MERFLNLVQLGVALDDQEIGATGRSVSDTCQQKSSDGVLFVKLMKQKMSNFISKILLRLKTRFHENEFWLLQKGITF
jgi:hypothetical protein